MTLDEAIIHAEEVAEINQTIAYNTDDDNWMDIAQCEKCAKEHRQLAEWLKDYKRLMEQQSILDKIRAEIEKIHLIGYATVDGKREIASRAVMQIIDKYKAESKEEE